MSRLPHLLGLEAFDAAARLLSFSEAGRQLHLSQAAVSHRIRALEESLGVRLFRRSTRRVALTPEGRVLHQATRHAFEEIIEAVRQVEAMSNPDRVTVSCSPSFAIRWLVPHLSQFRELHPEIETRIHAAGGTVEPGVAGIDLCIRFGAGGYPGFNATQLTHEVVLAVFNAHYAREVSLTSVDDLRTCTLLHDDVFLDHPLHLGWDEWSREIGVELDTRHGLRFSHAHLAIDAAMAGQGVALARLSLVRHALELGTLQTLPDVQVKSGLNYWLLTPRGPQHEAVETFANWLFEAIRAESA